MSNRHITQLTKRLPVNKSFTLSVISRKGGQGKTSVVRSAADGLALLGAAVQADEVDDNPRLMHITIGGPGRGEQPLDDTDTTWQRIASPGTYVVPWEITPAAQFARTPFLSKDTLARVCAARNWNGAAQPYHMVPGSEALFNLDFQLALESQGLRRDASGYSGSPFERYARSLDVVKPGYDFVLADTPPSLNLVQSNVIVASDYCIIVVGCDPDSLYDYDRTHNRVRDLQAVCRQLGRKPPEVLGVVYTPVDLTDALNDIPQLAAYTGQPVRGMLEALGLWEPARAFIDRQESEADQRRAALEACEKRWAPTALIPYPTLGIIPLDKRRLTATMKERMSVHTYAPTSFLGAAQYAMVTQIVRRLGVDGVFRPAATPQG